MSGLSPVPRIPKRPSTKNGADAATVAASATGIPIAAALPEPGDAARENAERCPRQSGDGDQRRNPLAGEPDRSPGDRREQPEANRGRQPGPLPPTAEREERLTDEARDGDYEQERPVRRQHRGRA